MLNKRKKRGSTLMMVIIMFAILSILGTSVIAMTSNDYYRRISETKRLENLYGAESGLDSGYNILAKNFESAVLYANKAVDYKVNQAQASGSLSKEELDKLKNKTFKENFNTFVNSTLDQCIEKSLVISIANYKDGLELDALIDASGNPNPNNAGYLLITNMNQITGTNIQSSVTPNKKKPDNINIDAELNDLFNIEITSRFTPNTEQPRKISAKYKINVPKYGFYLNYNDISMEVHPILNKTIAVDGDMTVSADTNVNGDIYVKGSEVASITDFTYDKYKGGIKVIGTGFDTEKTNFDVVGDIVTTKSLKVKEFSDVGINGDIFASSIALGRTSDTDIISTNSTFTNIPNNKGIHLSNDLAINGDDITTIINNFYGINDISINNGNKYSGEQSKAIDSSSIILNSNNNVSLKINELAYICGTAYINNDENEKYQTGESVAFKGNYVAYSDTLGKDNVKLDYYKPLQLISKINGVDITVAQKAEHFKEYWEKRTFDNIVDVQLPTETYTTGAYITNYNSNNKAEYDNKITADFEKNYIYDLRKKFINQVYYFGDFVNFNDGTEGDKLHEYFPFSPLTKATVQSEIDFDALVNKNEIDNEGNRVVFNNDISKTVVIEGTNNPNEIKEMKGLIITKGNVVITGKVKFTGAIFAAGNIIFDKLYSDPNSIIVSGNNLDVTSNTELNTKNILVQKDLQLVRSIVAKNYTILNKVINTDGSKNFPTEVISVTQTEINNDNTAFAVKNYIEKGTWKIESAN